MTSDRHYPGEPVFPDLAMIGRIETEVERNGRIECETRYYLCSLALCALTFARAVRAHWGVENRLHWVLDVIFREDLARFRTGHGPQNMAIIRHTALNLLARAKPTTSLKNRRETGRVERQLPGNASSDRPHDVQAIRAMGRADSSGHLPAPRSPRLNSRPKRTHREEPVPMSQSGLTTEARRRLAVERHQRSAVPALYRPHFAMPARTGTTVQGPDLELPLPRGGTRQASGRLRGHHHRRDRGHRRARRCRRDQRLRQPLRPSCGNLLCLERAGTAKEFSCIYHGWTYDLAGQLTGVAFEHGVKRQGGMPPEFRKDEHRLRRLRTAGLGGLVFGTFSDAAPDLESYLGPDVTRGLLRVMNRTPVLLGRSTQVMPNNWKLYFENVKDTYHASILHLFLTTFRINRLSMPGGIYIDRAGGNHYSYAKLDYAAEDADYKAAALRADSEFQLQDRSVVESVDEYGDGVSVQILTVFPGMVLQQVRNTIAVRVIRPRGVDKAELEWIHLGFDTDDEAMTERRLRQGNLIGAAGYISMEDGCVGGFVQRALQFNDDGARGW